MALKLIEQTDFSGGVNAVTNPEALSTKQVFRVRNLLTAPEHKSLVTRPGYTVVTTGTDTTNPIVCLGVFNTVAGNAYGFAVQNDGSIHTLYRTDTTPWTRIGSTATGVAAPPPDAVVVNDQLILVVGYETPWVWSSNGTTFTQITATGGQTVPPGARHAAFHLGSLWLWNTNPTTTTLDGPSSLRMSDANNVNSWPNANQTFIAKDDGQDGMGLASYTIVETGISPTATLVAFKDYSAYQVTGVFGASNFGVQKVKSDMGCVAPRTIQFVSGFGIIRLTHKGFALYNGVDDKLISEEVRPYIFGGDEIGGLNFGSLERAWATQVQNPPLYIAACPTSSTFLDRFFVYDLVRRSWSICDYPVNVNGLTLFATTSSAAQPEVRAGRNTAGQVLRIFNQSDTTDNGSAVAWSFRTRTFTPGSSMRTAYWRRAVLDLQYTPTQSVTVNTTLDRTSVSRTYSFEGTASGATYGSGVYGQAVYGGGTTVNGRESGGILRTSESAYSTISGTGNVRVRGFGFQVMPKPVKRLTTAGAI